MSEKPNRPFFRFHLLTLVLMALAAGGFVWTNAHSTSFMYARTEALPNGGMEFTDYLGTAYGWPWLWVWNVEPHCQWQGTALVGDVGIGISVVVTTALIFESLLRHRERRRP